MRKLLMILALCMPAAMHAESMMLPIDTRPCVWHNGNDATWAARDLDESGWRPYADWQIDPAQPFIWVRCHADLARLRTLSKPALQVDMLAAYEVYIDGVRIGGAGDVQTGAFNWDTTHSLAIPASLLEEQGQTTVALRVTHRIFKLLPIGPLPPLALVAGDAAGLQQRRASLILKQTSSRLVNFLCFGVIGVIGFLMLGLYCLDRSRTEFLLISCVAIGGFMLRAGEFCMAAMLPYSFLLSQVVVMIGNTADCADTFFFFRMAGRRVPKIYLLFIVVSLSLGCLRVVIALLPPGPGLAFHAFLIRDYFPFSLTAYFLKASSPFAAFLPWSRLPRRLRSLGVLCMIWGSTNMTWFFLEATELGIPGVPPNLYSHWGHVMLDMRATTTAASVLGVLVLLFRDQQKIAQERANLAGEMQAAREVQQRLVPVRLPIIPGFSLEAAYLPATEVGGDFYQVLKQADGSTLIIVGDVSGKGLKAAMTGALAIGAIRTLATEGLGPAALLERLNAQMVAAQNEGFITCICARLTGDIVTLSNAGHLSPYCDGREIPVEASLPLGLLAGTQYGESTLQLLAGETLTLISDGVVEAQDTSGELFGFDRTAAISTQSAETIAEAAQAFGQEDDITVLRVTFASEEVSHG
jgi:hypothetical protein